MTMWIEDHLYNQILAVMPVACIDLIIVHDGKFFLGKRTNEPAKGEWFLPGGRIRKGETLQVAAARILQDELAVDVSPERFSFVTTGETLFIGDTPDTNKHTVNSVFMIRVSNEEVARMSASQHSETSWFSLVDEQLHPYVRQSLAVAGFK